jgi:PadR family transcriptional regulator, regulatory protein PadR
MPREPNPNFMAGVPELMILRLLQDREMYGYELVQAIRTQSADVISFGEGVVYPVLHSIEDDGAVTSRRKLVDGRSRVYYSLTANGARRYRKLADTWSSLAQAIQSVLKEPRHATEL